MKNKQGLKKVIQGNLTHACYAKQLLINYRFIYHLYIERAMSILSNKTILICSKNDKLTYKTINISN